MKRILNYFLLTFAAAAVFTACNTKELVENTPEVGVKVLTAYTDSDIATKTSLNGVSVIWSESDVITAFDVDGTGHSSTQTQISENGKVAQFTIGDLTIEDDVMMALYPANASATMDDDMIITTEIPSEQIAVANSFANGANVAIAEGQGTELKFKNAGAIASFTLVNDNVKSVKLTSINAEPVAGSCAIMFNKNDGVECEATTDSNNESITLVAPGDGCFAANTPYYFVILPGTYSGFRLEFTSSDNKTAKLKNATEVIAVSNDNYNFGTMPDLSGKWKSTTTYVASFSINGIVNDANNQELAADAVVSFPEVVAPDGKVFVGWAKNAIDGTQDTVPEMVTVGEEVMGTENTTYHAVFATQSGSGTSSLTKMVKGDVLHDGDKIVIVAPDSNVALYRETVSTSYVNKYTFDNNITTVMADDKNWIPINAVEGGFSLGDAANGYIYSSSNNLYCGETQQAWTLKDLNDGTFKLQRDGRYLSYRSDLSNKYWRMGGASYGTSGETTLNLYKLDNGSISFSEYCTIVATLTSVTISGTPQKTSYFENERFDVTGLVVTANYSDGSNPEVTSDAQWTITPSLLSVGSTSVSVVAKYENVSSEAQNYNVTVSAVTLESISVKTNPTKTTYFEGETFDPTGLVITRTYNNNTSDEYSYAEHASEFSFTPSLTTALAPTNNKVTITYGGKSAEQTITVKAPLGSMDEIFAAATAAGSMATPARVTFNNWVVSGVKNNNAYVTDGTKGFIIYSSGHGFVTGDILSGTVNCNVQLYNGASELTSLTTATDGLTVTKGGTITPASISIAELSGVNTGAVITFESLRYNGSTFSDGSNTIKPYNGLITLPSLTSGRDYQVTGVYVQYNTTKEIAPRTTDDFVLIETPYLNASANKTTGISASGETITITVDTNVDDWNVKSDNAAFVVGAKSGNTVPVVVSENTSTTDGRTAKITVSATGVNDIEIILTQVKAGGSSTPTYSKVTSAPTDWSGTYILVYDGKVCTAGEDAASNYVTAIDNSGVITGDYSSCEVEIASYSTGYSIKALGGTNAGKYLEGKGSSTNGTTFASSASKVTTLSLKDGVVTITNNTNVFAYNSAANNLRWRFFKSGTASGSGYYKPTLYKKN